MEKPKELTREEYEALCFDEVRCTGCTPCCMSHVHTLYDGRVLWACQTKIERREREAADGRA